MVYLQPLHSTVHQELNNAVEQGIDGVILYVDKKGAEPAYFVSGVDNRTSLKPVRPDALFKIGSIAKLYDAAAITKLASAGKLNLDNHLADYLPFTRGRIEHAEQITVRMMVQHRSGIPNFTAHKRFHWGNWILTSRSSSWISPLILLLILIMLIPTVITFCWS